MNSGPRPSFGFVQRLYAATAMRQIRPLQIRGLSANDIAIELNRSGKRAVNGAKWDAENIASVLALDESIRSSDAMHRV